MALKALSERGLSNMETARTLNVTEGTVRFHLKREGASDGRSRQRPLASSYRGQIEGWLEAAEEEGVNLSLLHEWLARFAGTVTFFGPSSVREEDLEPQRVTEGACVQHRQDHLSNSGSVGFISLATVRSSRALNAVRN